MDYKPHLQRIEEQYGKLEGYSECTDFDKCVIILKKNGCTYKQIQKWLGSPSKELIKEVIYKYVPETLNNECNKNKLKSYKNPNEQRLRGLLKIGGNKLYELDEFGLTNFWDVEGKLYFMDDNDKCYVYNEFDERTQLSIIYNVARVLNIELKDYERD